MNRLMPNLLHMTVAVSVLLGTFVASSTPGAVYIVDSEATAEGSGTAAAPFQTISQAATRMKAGDICRIRAGVYRETVTLDVSGTRDKPIVFEACEGEDVTLTGCDPVGGWSKYQEATYKADVALSLGHGNQVFADGQLMAMFRVPQGEQARLRVSQFGGQEKRSQGVVKGAPEWRRRKLQFTTGPENTSAVVWLERTSGGDSPVYVDDPGLRLVDAAK